MPLIIQRRVTSRLGEEPITIDEAKLQLRIELDNTNHDDDLNQLIARARDMAEQYTGEYWRRATVQAHFDAFPPASDPFRLPFKNVISIDGLTYLDSTYAEQTIAVNLLTLYPGRQIFTYSAGWPAGTMIELDIEVGPDVEGSPADIIPEGVKAGMLMFLTALDQNREATLPVMLYENPAISAALFPYRGNLGF